MIQVMSTIHAKDSLALISIITDDCFEHVTVLFCNDWGGGGGGGGR